MTGIVWKPLISVVNVKLRRATGAGMFFVLSMSEACHVGLCYNSRQVVACIMTCDLLFIMSSLYGLLDTCLYDNKYCLLAGKLILLFRFLLPSFSCPEGSALSTALCCVLRNCWLPSNAVLIPQAIILPLQEGNLPLNRSDLINSL